VRDTFPVHIVWGAKVSDKICSSFCCPYTEIIFSLRLMGQVDAGMCRGALFPVMMTEYILINAKDLTVTRRVKNSAKKPLHPPSLRGLDPPKCNELRF